MFGDPGVGNKSIGSFLRVLKPDSGMDGFRNFLDRLGSDASAAIASVLVSESFTNPPPAPMDGPMALTLNVPSVPFQLLPQAKLPDGDYMTPREGSAFFTCKTTQGKGIKIQIKGLSASDVGSIGVRIVDTHGTALPIPYDGMRPEAVNYDSGSGIYSITLTMEEDYLNGSFSLISVYNRVQNKSFSNLVLTVVE